MTYNMMMRTWFLSLSIVLTACTSNTGTDIATEENQGSPEAITFSGEQMKMAGITTGNPVKMVLSEELSCNGNIEVTPAGLVTLSLPVDAYVKEVNYNSGAGIRRGDLLVIMEHPDILMLQKEYLVLGYNLAMLKQDMERQEALVKEDASSAKNLMTAETEYYNMMAEHAALKESLKLIGIDPDQMNVNSMSPEIRLLSPITGHVRRNYTNTGKLMNAGEAIMMLEDLDALHLHLQVYENDIQNLKVGQEVVFTTASSDYAYAGSIYTVGKTIHEDNRSADVFVRIENPDGSLISGMYAKAKIRLENRQVLAVPETAIAREGRQYFIFIKTGNSFERIPVKTGITQKGFIEIIHPEDLAGSEIALSGAYYLNAGFSEE